MKITFQIMTYKKTLFNSGGVSVIEVMIAVAIFLIFSTGVVGVLLQGVQSNRLGSEQLIAGQFASEGLEAVRSIKNQSFASVINSGGTGIVRNGTTGVWEFSGSNNTLEKYTRVITVEDVRRDGVPPAGNIVASGGTVDSDSKKVTSTVSWNVSGARNNSVVLSTYLSDWEKPISGGGPIMMAYSKTTAVPFYRVWDGSNWSSESSAQTVGGNINYIVLKSARTRNEAALGTMDASGNINIQIWNGTSWGAPTLMANVSAANSTTRSFDIAYEKNSDRLVVAYLPTSTSADFAYRIWNGTSWTAATTVTSPPTTAVIKSIDMTENPLSSSNEIAMIMMDNNVDVYGMVWTGSAWSTMGVASVWDANGSIATKKAVDVAYEQLTGRAVFIWGSATSTDQYYRIWNGTTLTSNTLLDIPAAGGVVHWVELVSRPNSNELLYGAVDAGSDLNTRKWSGSAWDTATQHPEHSAGVENITSMAFDLIWETNSANLGRAWLLMGNNNVVEARQWSGTAWGTTTSLAGSDDTSFIRLKADPSSGAVFAGIYQNITSNAGNARDITERRLTGGSSSWTSKNVIWAGPTTAEPVHFRIDIATP